MQSKEKVTITLEVPTYKLKELAVMENCHYRTVQKNKKKYVKVVVVSGKNTHYRYLSPELSRVILAMEEYKKQ